MLKVGDIVEVVTPFYWYEDERHEVGERFLIQEQHIGHNFESYVKKVDKKEKSLDELLTEFDNYMKNQSPGRNYHLAYIMCSLLDKTPSEIEKETGVTLLELEKYIKENNLEL